MSPSCISDGFGQMPFHAGTKFPVGRQSKQYPPNLRRGEYVMSFCLARTTDTIDWCCAKTSSRGGTCAGVRTARLDRGSAALIGVGLARPFGAALLSRQLVSVLPPPVGGLPRSLSGNSGRGRKRSGRLGRCACGVGGLARPPLVAFSDFVRYGAVCRQALGYLQSKREGRHCQARGLHRRSGPGRALRRGGHGYEAGRGCSNSLPAASVR